MRAAAPLTAVVVAAATTCAWAASPADAAQSASGGKTRTVCAARAAVYDTPGGIVVGVLARGARVRVIVRGADPRWRRIRSVPHVIGWLREATLC